MLSYILLNIQKIIFTQEGNTSRKIFQGVGNLIYKGLGSRSLYSLQAALNTQYKAFFLILIHLGGIWQKASEPSK
jgi:hypothetical protein